MVSCLSCFGKKSNGVDSQGPVMSPVGQMHNASVSMFSAVDGERNSVTSFVSFELDERDDKLAELEARGRSTVRLFKSLVEDKTGLVANGSVGDTSLWFAPRSVGGMPLIAVGEVRVSASVSLDRISAIIMELSTKADWDPEFLMGKEISRSQIDESTWIRTCWAACKSKPAIAGRDFVYHAFNERTESSWVVASWSVDIDECPPDFAPKVASAVHVRGKVFLGGFFVRKDDNSWLISYANQVDVGISSWLSEPVLKKNPQLLNKLKFVLEKIE